MGRIVLCVQHDATRRTGTAGDRYPTRLSYRGSPWVRDMPAVTTYQAILPILNETCVTFSGPSWWLADGLQVRRMTAQEERLVSEQSPRGFRHRVEAGQRLLAMTELEAGPYEVVRVSHEAAVSAAALCAQVAFNLVAESDPVVIPYGVVVSEAYTRRVRCVYEFDAWGDTIALRRLRYRVKQDIDRSEVQALFQMALSTLRGRPELRVTLTRMCSALVKANPEDKLIDLTISLESLVPGSGEFRFRFSYFLSLLVESGRDERKQAFEQLRTLYDARSALVHGSADRQRVIDRAIRAWPTLEGFARRCVLYRLEFERTASDLTWEEHLEGLAYGQPPLI